MIAECFACGKPHVGRVTARTDLQGLNWVRVCEQCLRGYAAVTDARAEIRAGVTNWLVPHDPGSPHRLIKEFLDGASEAPS